jgi:hypothetical protein
MPEADKDDVVARAVQSLLNQVPTTPDTAIPATALQQRQPWADIAATPGTDKKSLEDLVAEYEAKIAESPGAEIPPSPFASPSVTYMERFSRPAQRPGKRRRRRKRGPGTGAGSERPVTAAGGTEGREGRPGQRRRRGGRPPATAPATTATPGTPPSAAAGEPGATPRRRRRRRRGGRGSGSSTPGTGGEQPAS